MSFVFEEGSILFDGDVALSIDPLDNGERILEFTPGAVQAYDYGTLEALGPAASLPATATAIYGVAPRPAHDHAVIIASPGLLGGPQVLVIRLSDLAIRGSCPLAMTPAGVLERGRFFATFSSNQRYAIIDEPSAAAGARELLRVDMDPVGSTAEACTVLALDQVCSMMNFSGRVAAGEGETIYALLDDPANRGIAEMVVRSSPTRLACTGTPMSGQFTEPFNPELLFYHDELLWYRSAALTSAMIVPTESLFGLFDGDPDGVPFYASLPTTDWITTGTEVFDAAESKVLWRRDLDWRRLPDVHPTRPEILIPTSAPTVLRKFRFVIGARP